MTPYHESNGVKGTAMNKWTRHRDENGYWRHVYTLPDHSRVEIQRDPQGTEFAWLVIRYRANDSWRGISPCRTFAKARGWAKFVIEHMKSGSPQEAGL